MHPAILEIRDRIAPDYIDTVLVNERAFYETVRSFKFEKHKIRRVVLSFMEKLECELWEYNDDLIKPAFNNGIFTEEEVTQAINDIYDYYAEEREELKERATS